MSWLLNFIPGGQIVGIFGAVAKAVAALIKAAVEAVTVMLANPVVFLAVGVAFGFGVYEGIRWDAHKVKVAQEKIDAIHIQWAQANESNRRDVDAALAARRDAEDLAKKVEAESKRAAARAADAQRVRKPVSAPAPVATGWSLPGVPVVPQPHKN